MKIRLGMFLVASTFAAISWKAAAQSIEDLEEAAEEGLVDTFETELDEQDAEWRDTMSTIAPRNADGIVLRVKKGDEDKPERAELRFSDYEVESSEDLEDAFTDASKEARIYNENDPRASDSTSYYYYSYYRTYYRVYYSYSYVYVPVYYTYTYYAPRYTYYYIYF